MKLPLPIVITGFMGCGKTEVARKLAARLSLSMIDLDDAITARAGRTPARLISEDGEPAFRKIETEVLRDLLSTRSYEVIALGGGAWIQKTNRLLLDEAKATSVWLDTPFAVCWQRIEASEDDRPLGKTRDQAAELFEQRVPIYQLSSVRIEASADDTTEVLVSRIELALSWTTTD